MLLVVSVFFPTKENNHIWLSVISTYIHNGKNVFKQKSLCITIFFISPKWAKKNIRFYFQTFRFILPEGNPIKAASCTEISGLQTQPFQPNPRFVVRRRHETSPTGGSDLRLITRQRLHNRQQPRPVPVSSIKSRETIRESPAGLIFCLLYLMVSPSIQYKV